MSDLPHSFAGYIQVEETQFKAAVSEYTQQKIGQNINYIVGKGLVAQEFTSSGTFTVPAGNGVLCAIGWGGGAGGVDSAGFGSSPVGQAAVMGTTFMTLAEGDVLTITIGGGGGGGVLASPGAAGGASTIFLGPTQKAFFGGAPFISTGVRIPGVYAHGTDVSSTFFGGNGGPGGNGGNAGANPGVSSAAANSGAGGGMSSVVGNTAGTGGSGKIILFYV